MSSRRRSKTEGSVGWQPKLGVHRARLYVPKKYRHLHSGKTHLSFYAKKAGDAVTLHFDKEKRMVGIAPAEREDDSAYALTKGPTQQRYISAGAFMRFYRISLERAKRYPARYDNGMLIVELVDRPGLKEKVLRQIEREDETNGYSQKSRSTGGATRRAGVA